MCHSRLFQFVMACSATLFMSVSLFADGNVDLPRYPSISPDGASVSFSWKGDLWLAPMSGGQATRLTTHPGRETRSAWLPDGSRIFFESDRNGTRNIFSLETDGTDLKQVTDTDAAIFLNDVAGDAEGDPLISLTGYLEGDVYRDARPYEVAIEGGQPHRVHDAFGRASTRSPDGSTVAFVRGNSSWSRRHYRGPDDRDVWIYNPTDDSFTQLTDWEGNDGRPRWGDDESVLYLSDRERDTLNLYRHKVGVEGAEPTPLTRFEEQDIVDFDVTPDGKTAVLHRWDTLYALDLTDPNAVPRPIALHAAEDEMDGRKFVDVSRKTTEALLNPDGKSMAFIAYGELYVRGTGKTQPTRRVTHTHGREKDIAWSPDGTKLYFVGDQDGSDSIYVATVERTRGELRDSYREMTEETEVTEEAEKTEEVDAEAADEKEEPATEDETTDADPVTGTWKSEVMVPGTGLTTVTIELTLGDENKVEGTFSSADFDGTITGTFDPEESRLRGECTTSRSAPLQLNAKVTDGSMEGELSMTEGGPVIPFSAVREGGDEEDSAAEEKTEENKEEAEEEDDPADDPARWADALQFNIEPLLAEPTNDHSVVPAPDGMSIAFTRGLGDIMILDLATNEVRTLQQGWDAWSSFTWSPDSRWIAFVQSDRNFNDDIYIVPADGSAKPVNITRHPDGDDSPSFSADGKSLAFRSRRTGDEFDVWHVFLDEKLEGMSGPERDEYFKDAGSSAKKLKPLDAAKVRKALAEAADPEAEQSEDEYEAPFTNADLESAYLRLRRLTSMAGNEGNVQMLPSGEHVVFSASGSGVSGLYSTKYNGSGRKRIADSASLQGISPNGAKLSAVASGQGRIIDSGSGKTETVSIQDRMEVDLREESSAKFLEAARIMGDMFYHPTMKDLDWPAVTDRYHELASKARTAEEFNWVASGFLGELNASHLGIRSSDARMPLTQSQGRLGTVHEPVEGGYLVNAIIPDSVAEKTEMPIEVGDVITGIDFEMFDADEVPIATIESLLKGKIGDEVVVSVRRSNGMEGEDAGFDQLELLIKPMAWSSLRGLIYKQMQLRNAELVHEWSDGRLGYAHVKGMSQPSLDEFERDLFAATEGRDGLLVDVRNNGGGWTADRLLASLMVQPHAYTVPRGADPSVTNGYPQDRLFIQRYTMPVNMLCNEKSFSNAEIVSHAFKALDRGTLVGQQTYGGVISTGGTTLIDGTSVRLPFRGWYLMDGTDMENNGAMPDIVVVQTPEDESRSHDAQLKAAVDDLLLRLDESK